MAEDDGGFPPLKEEDHPPLDWPRYASSRVRAPLRPPHQLERTLTELTGPLLADLAVRPGENDLSRGAHGVAIGQLMVLTGRVLDEDGRPVRDTLVELWQANAAGRYDHPNDRHDAPLDPNFQGHGRCVTDGDGRYSFVTIKPGAYPVPNTGNWWRPPHIHFSLFGPCFLTRLITQMYFPGEPLNDLDHILSGVPEAARGRLIAEADLGIGVPEVSLGFRFDLVLRGRHATPLVD